MNYQIRYKPHAERDIRRLPRDSAARILKAIGFMATDLRGDVKCLKNREPGYRLRVGDYRVMFDIEGSSVIVYEVLHRRDAYRRH